MEENIKSEIKKYFKKTLVRKRSILSILNINLITIIYNLFMLSIYAAIIFVLFLKTDIYAFDFNDFLKNISSYEEFSTQKKEYIQIDSSTQTKTEEETIQDYDEIFKWKEESWNKFIKKMEKGEIEEEKKDLPKSEIVISTQPTAPPPQVEFLDSGTSLNVTGRKVISINYSGKKYINEQTTSIRSRSTSLFDINQQLQIRMQGKVGEKINVNVDYDDTKPDKQDISITYQGDPQEVVQNISFGDIDLSLPATEFVSYNKQLFGIRADIKSNKLKATFIGSRTKGQTKTKQFKGSNYFQSVDIYDSSYIRRKYYDITFGNSNILPIKNASEVIYIDRQTNENVDGIIISSITADDFNIPTVTYTGRFKKLIRGIDYSIDYNKGIVIFERSLNPQDAVIIDYQDKNNNYLSSNTGRPKILKAKDDIYISNPNERGWKNEIKTYYFIGQTNIIRDDGTGNFILKVQNLNRQEIGSSLNPPQKYPDTIEVNFEEGIIHLLNPFVDENGNPDPLTYSPSPIPKRIIHVEFYSKVKTFFLEPNIVLNSEVIILDGKKLTKNVDYYLDYDSGFLTFYNTEKITNSSVIDVTYEVSPFGGSNQTLAGGRVSYDISSKMSIGGTMIYQGSSKSSKAPSITDIANTLSVYDSDLQFKNINILGIQSNLSAEIALSKLNPNIDDYAIIENMESSKQEDTASMDKNFWQIASNPTSGPADPYAIDWNTVEINSRDINPNNPENSKQQVLVVDYDFSISSEVSIVYVFSKTGLDFSKKNSFEITLSGDNDSAGPLLNLTFGEINEDSDGSGGVTLVCSNGKTIYNAPKTEDINCDGILSPDEDKGWLYSPSGLSSKRFGANNGRIDTQDLDGNGRLDPGNPAIGGSFGYLTGSYFTDITDSNNQKNEVNFSNWHTWVYPIVISSTEAYKWSNIKQVRLSLKKGTNTPTKGKIKIAKISAVGNNWNIQTSTYTSENIKVITINNTDNPTYIPIYNAGGRVSDAYNNLYGSVSSQRSSTGYKTIQEQALLITISTLSSTSSSYVYRKFSTPIDVSQHEKISFILYNTEITNNINFYLKFGTENNYFKASVPLNFTGWRLFEIEQIDSNNDGIAESWKAIDPDITISTNGNVSLQQIPKIIAGFETNSTSTFTHTVYLNDIFLSKPLKRTGNARKISGDFEIPSFARFGGKHRFVDRAFQTPVTAITNQDNEQNTAYLNLLKPRFFPTSYTYSRQNTNTPNIYNTGNNNLVNMLQMGRVKKEGITASGLLDIPIIPQTNLNYTKNNTKYELIDREDDKNTYSASTNFKFPLDLFFLPKNISLNYTYIANKINYNLLISTKNYSTDERTNSYSIKLSFIPIKDFTINPSYSLSTVREKRFDNFSSFSYPKSMQQNIDLNSNIRIFKWLNPYMSYSLTTTENNNITPTTVTLANQTTYYLTGQIKTINRNANGNINLTINMTDIFPKVKPIRSIILNMNYQLQDGDTWSNIEKEFESKKKLWIRDSLKPKNPFAQRNTATYRDSYNSSLRWQPFEAYTFENEKLKPLSTLSITNNFNYSKQDSYSNNVLTQTQNKTLPDLIVSLSQIEKIFSITKWMSASTLNIKYNKNINTVINTSRDTSNSYGTDLRFNLLNSMNTSISYNSKETEKYDIKLKSRLSYTKHKDFSIQTSFYVKSYRFTPKLDYSNYYSESTLKTVTANTTSITPSVLIRTDVKIPRTIKLPFINETTFENRIIWTTNISYTIKKSPISINDNNRLFSLNSNSDIEISKNLRLGFNLILQRFWHKYLKQEDYFSYQFGSNIILQF